MTTTGRNERCPCGSGKKYKKCCLHGDELQSRTEKSAKLGRSESDYRSLSSHAQVAAAANELLDAIESGAINGDVIAATESLAQAQPEHHMSHYVRGVYLAIIEEDAHGALPHFERAAEIQPKMSEAHFNVGMSRMQLGRLSAAHEAFSTAIRTSRPGDGIAQEARRAIEMLDELVRSDGKFQNFAEYAENERRFNAAYSAHADDQFESAIDGYRKVLEKDPEHLQSYGNMALAEAQLGRKAVALKLLDKALELDPEYHLALTNRKAIAAMEEGTPGQLGSMGQIRFNELKHRVDQILGR